MGHVSVQVATSIAAAAEEKAALLQEKSALHMQLIDAQASIATMTGQVRLNIQAAPAA